MKIVYLLISMMVFFSCNKQKFTSNTKPVEIPDIDVHVSGIEQNTNGVNRQINLNSKINFSVDATGQKVISQAGAVEATRVDAVFVLDVSNSMKAFIETVKNQMADLAEKLNADHIDLRASTIGFVDSVRSTEAHNESEFRSIADSSGLAAFERDLNNLDGDSKNNFDLPEAGLYAISKATDKLNAAGNSSAVKLIFYVSDAPAHNGTAEDFRSRPDTKRNCDLDPVANKMKTFANALEKSENFRFYYSVRPFQFVPDHSNKCEHTDFSVPSRTGPEQMDELMRLTGLKGGSLDQGISSSWPLGSTSLVTSLVDAVKQAVDLIKVNQTCLASKVDLQTGNRQGANTVWSANSVNEVFAIKQNSSNRLIFPGLKERIASQVSSGMSFKLDVNRCCFNSISSSSTFSACDSEYTQTIDYRLSAL